MTTVPPVRLVALDVDGTLTDGTTWFAGDDLGWVQRYSVRDGEAILRITRRGIPVVPLSRNKTSAARRRMELLGLPTRWLGIDDKPRALEEICAEHAIAAEDICFVGDGRDDAPVLAQVGVSVAVSGAHPDARAVADLVTQSPGGAHALEEVELFLEQTGRIPPFA